MREKERDMLRARNQAAPNQTQEAVKVRYTEEKKGQSSKAKHKEKQIKVTGKQ